MTDEHGKLLDHDYDGIRELDNDLPRWWLYLFYFTIAFGIVYMLYFHVFNIGYLSADQYRKEMDPNYVRTNTEPSRFLGILPSYHSPFYVPEGDNTKLKAGQAAKPAYVEQTRESDTTTYVALTDKDDINEGHEIFLKNCSPCHGQLGQGGIGPNLTDNYWLHGGQFSDIVKTIKFGYPSKGMIAWRTTLNPEDILKVASFVRTLKGTNPPNAKAPQGVLVND